MPWVGPLGVFRSSFATAPISFLLSMNESLSAEELWEKLLGVREV